MMLDVSIAPMTPPLWKGDTSGVVIGVHVQLSEAKWRAFRHEDDFDKALKRGANEDDAEGTTQIVPTLTHYLT